MPYALSGIAKRADKHRLENITRNPGMTMLKGLGKSSPLLQELYLRALFPELTSLSITYPYHDTLLRAVFLLHGVSTWNKQASRLCGGGCVHKLWSLLMNHTTCVGLCSKFKVVPLEMFLTFWYLLAYSVKGMSAQHLGFSDDWQFLCK